MCYGPHEHQQMMQDMARRTEGVTAPRLSLSPALGAIGSWIGGLIAPEKSPAQLQPITVRRDPR